jgi:gentisate 1,2-dioxygenase
MLQSFPRRVAEKEPSEGLIYEYTKAANPQGAGAITPQPYAEFPGNLHQEGPTRVIPFDLSEQLRCPAPATSPALYASYLRIRAGETLETSTYATSEVLYAIRGRGRTRTPTGEISWKQGDVIALPGTVASYSADEDAAFYRVNDEPLLRYLGVRPATLRLSPTVYRVEEIMAEVEKVRCDPDASRRNRVSVLLANKLFPQTMTITHVLWMMVGTTPAGAIQPPHRHQSVALDFIIECRHGCYTLVGTELDPDGRIIDPVRVDWKTASAFVTPPGYWHEHHNESGADAFLMPIQDAGLHTYLRTLDIRFHPPKNS